MNSYNFPPIFSVTTQHPTLFFGLTLFYMDLPERDPSLTFSTSYSSNMVTISTSTSASYYTYYTFYAAFPYFVCNDSLYPIFDPITLTCGSITCAATL